MIIAAISSDSFNVPASLFVWIGGLSLSALGFFFAASISLLWTIHRDLVITNHRQELSEQKTDSRLETLERHDRRNAKETMMMLRAMMKLFGHKEGINVDLPDTDLG